MIPTNGSSFGRAGGRLRRYPGGTENASIFATVRGSIPNRRAASRRLIPSTSPARPTCPYSSPPFIPPPSAHLGRRPSHAGLLLRPCRPIRPLYEGLSLRRSHVNPDTNVLLQANTNAGDKLRQVAFDSAVMRHLGSTLFVERVKKYQEMKRLDEKDYRFSEADLVRF